MPGKPCISFYDQALKLLSNRPHAEKELYRKLEILSKKRYNRRVYRRKSNPSLASSFSVFENEATPENDKLEIEETMAKLKNEGFLDDKVFSQWYCMQRQDYNPRSERLLKLELQMKGVDPSIIREAINECHDEDACCVSVARRKMSSMSRDKLTSYLLGKGFHIDTIRRALSKLSDLV